MSKNSLRCSATQKAQPLIFHFLFLSSKPSLTRPAFVSFSTFDIDFVLLLMTKLYFVVVECLALPKLNMQFLTLHDYLLRNHNLFQLESTCKITVLSIFSLPYFFYRNSRNFQYIYMIKLQLICKFHNYRRNSRGYSRCS